jgi:predicted MFS family arabinose efflux permease
MSTTAPQRRGFADRIGFPVPLAWGLLAVMVFLVGDGIETTWITNYLHTTEGYSVAAAGLVVTFYGIVVAIGAFLSGALADAIGPRLVMFLGAASFVVFDLLFILVALPLKNYPLLVVVYGLRGLGYPLFAYGFLTWVMQTTDPEHRSSAAGWFWFAFSVGIQILGSYAASLFLPLIGNIGTLWIGLGLAVVGAAIALLLIPRSAAAAPTERKTIGSSLFSGMSIAWRRPKVGLGGILKVINLSGPYALQVFYLPYLIGQIGMTESRAILVFTFFGIFAVLGNLFWGYMGDVIGWQNSVRWFATLLCCAGLLYLYLVPLAVGPNFWVIVGGTVLMGAGVSAFVPLTPLMVAHAPGETGAALSIVNFGSGLAAFVGPALVSVLFSALGVSGVVYAIAALYLVGFVLASFISLPGGARKASSTTVPATAAPSANEAAAPGTTGDPSIH